jgi:hypothetical protein
MVLRRYHRASGTYFMAVQARYVSVLPVLSLARGHLQQPPSGFEADLIHLERVHLELLSEKAPIDRAEEPISQPRISDFQTRFAMEIQLHHPCPPSLANDW